MGTYFSAPFVSEPSIVRLCMKLNAAPPQAVMRPLSFGERP
jgi:hypothetical protein